MTSFTGQLNLRSKLGILDGIPTRKLRVEVGGRFARDSSEHATVLELSRTGFLLYSHSKFSVGEPIEVSFSNAEGLLAEVVWVGEEHAACTFQKKLTIADLAQVKLRTRQSVASIGKWQSGDVGGTPSDTLGQRIKALRKRRGYSMTHFASRVGVSKPTLWRWEKDAVLPRQKLLRAIAFELGTSEEALLYGDARNGGEQAVPVTPGHRDQSKAMLAKIDDLATTFRAYVDGLRI